MPKTLLSLSFLLLFVFSATAQNSGWQESLDDYEVLPASPKYFELTENRKLLLSQTQKEIASFSRWGYAEILHMHNGNAIVLYRTVSEGSTFAAGFQTTAGYVIFKALNNGSDYTSDVYDIQDYKLIEGKYIMARKNNVWQLMDSYGVYYGDKYEDVGYGVSDGLLAVKKNGRWGFVSFALGYNPRVIIAPSYASASSFKNGKALVSNIVGGVNYYGVIDTEGNIVTPLQYTTQEHDLSNGNVVMYNQDRDKKAGVLQSTGQVLVPFDYSYIERVETVDSTVFICNQGKYTGAINASGKTIIPFVYDSIEKEQLWGTVYLFQCILKKKSYWFNTKGESSQAPR